jgi:hypothetical protein
MSTFLFTSSVPNIKGNWPPKSCFKNVSLVQSYLNRWASLFSPFSPVNPFANGLLVFVLCQQTDKLPFAR